MLEINNLCVKSFEHSVNDLFWTAFAICVIVITIVFILGSLRYIGVIFGRR